MNFLDSRPTGNTSGNRGAASGWALWGWALRAACDTSKGTWGKARFRLWLRPSIGVDCFLPGLGTEETIFSCSLFGVHRLHIHPPATSLSPSYRALCGLPTQLVAEHRECWCSKPNKTVASPSYPKEVDLSHSVCITAEKVVKPESSEGNRLSYAAKQRCRRRQVSPPWCRNKKKMERQD